MFFSVFFLLLEDKWNVQIYLPMLMQLRADVEMLSPMFIKRLILANIITEEVSLNPERTFAALMPK